MHYILDLCWVIFTTKLLGRNLPYIKKGKKGGSKSLGFKSKHFQIKFSVLLPYLPLQKHLFCLSFPPHSRQNENIRFLHLVFLKTVLPNRCIGAKHFEHYYWTSNVLKKLILCPKHVELQSNYLTNFHSYYVYHIF